MKTLLGSLVAALAIPAVAYSATETGGVSVSDYDKLHGAEEPQMSDDDTGKKFNVRVNPLGLAFGFGTIEADYGLDPAFTVGPTFSYISVSLFDVGLKARSYGVRSNFYLNGQRSTSGFYLAPFANYAPFTVSEGISGDEYRAQASALSLGSLIGYQWIWNNGFNLGLGGGLAFFTIPSTLELHNSKGTQLPEVPIPLSGLRPSAEFTVGWAF